MKSFFLRNQLEMKMAPDFSQIKEAVKKDCVSLKSAFASQLKIKVFVAKKEKKIARL